MADKNQNQRTIFLENSNPVDTILNILKNNGLEETIDDIYKNFKEKKPSRLSIISQLVKDIASEKISDKELSLSLQKQLGISENISKKLTDDIKSKLVSSTERVLISENKSREEVSTSFIKKTPYASVEENEKVLEEKRAKFLIKNPEIKEGPGRKMKKLPKELSEEETSKLPKKIIQQERPKSSGPDSYREPIG